jgi:hypothetical protein
LKILNHRSYRSRKSKITQWPKEKGQKKTKKTMVNNQRNRKLKIELHEPHTYQSFSPLSLRIPEFLTGVTCFDYVICIYSDILERLPYQMMVMSFNNNTTGATGGAVVFLPFRSTWFHSWFLVFNHNGVPKFDIFVPFSLWE